MAISLLGSGTGALAEDASTEEVGFQSGASEVEEKGQEGECFHGPLATAEPVAGGRGVEGAAVLVVVLGFEDESRQPANRKRKHLYG